jgi:hypothetical protein
MNTTPTARGPLFQPAYYRPWLRFIETTESADGGAGGGEDKGKEGGEGDTTFTQADVDKLVSKVRGEERRKASEKFADYDELKTKADGAKTVEDQLADLAKKHAAAETRALRSDIAAAHGISKEDRDTFLTGTDEETLTRQATRLAEMATDRKKNGNVAPKEGSTKNTGDAKRDLREFTRNLFGDSD